VNPASCARPLCAFLHAFFRIAIIATLTIACCRSALCGEIHNAARDGHLLKVNELLAAEPDLVFSKDPDGLTALHWAARTKHVEIARALLEGKAVADAKDNDGWTPLHWAASTGDPVMAELLLDNKASVDARASDGTTPLHWAADKGHADVVKALLARKANVNATEIAGQTPLHWAARAGHDEVVTLLIAGKADINLRDHKGATPLDSAEEKGREGAGLLLCMKGGHDSSKSCMHLTQPVVVSGQLQLAFGLSLAGPSPSLWIKSDGHIGSRGWPCEGGNKPVCYKVYIRDNARLPPEWRKGELIQYNAGEGRCNVRGSTMFGDWIVADAVQCPGSAPATKIQK
jgi:ankyrin repeat protein